MRKTVASLLASVLVATAAAPAAGQGAPADRHQSVVRFEEARRAIEAGNCPKAIPLLEESLQLNPSIGAHLSLSQCVAATDPARAWRELKLAERLALDKGDPRAAYAHQRAATLEPRLALVRIGVPLEAPGPDVVVRVDDAVVTPLDGLVAVQAGEREIEVTAPTKKRWSQTVPADVGAVANVSATLEDAGTDTSQAPPPIPADDGAPSPSPSRSPSPEPGAAQRTIGLVVGAVGVAAIAAGALGGILALVKKSDLEDQCASGGATAAFPGRCGGGSFPAATEAAVRSEASTMNAWATVSTVGFVAGVGLLATGVAVYVTAPTAPSRRTAAHLRVYPGGAGLVGGF